MVWGQGGGACLFPVARGGGGSRASIMAGRLPDVLRGVPFMGHHWEPLVYRKVSAVCPRTGLGRFWSGSVYVCGGWHCTLFPCQYGDAVPFDQ